METLKPEKWEERFWKFWRSSFNIEGTNGVKPIYSLNNGYSKFEEFIAQSRQDAINEYKEGLLAEIGEDEKFTSRIDLTGYEQMVQNGDLEEIVYSFKHTITDKVNQERARIRSLIASSDTTSKQETK